MQTIELSDAALAVLRSGVEGGSREVNDSNREAYRELARAGIIYPVSGFTSGPEYLFRWTDEGWERRFELSGERLQRVYPGRFAEGQLRTLQRRIREWRRVMARTLVHACLDGDEATGDPVVVGAERKG